MSSTELIRWGGLASILGGALLIGLQAVKALRPSAVLDGLSILSILLIMVGLVGLHGRQASRSGRLNRTDFEVAVVGATLMLIGLLTSLLASFDLLASLVPLGIVAFFTGGLAFAIGSLRLGSDAWRSLGLPPWAAVLIIVATVVLFQKGSLGALSGIAWVILGYTLWSDKGYVTEQPERQVGKPPISVWRVIGELVGGGGFGAVIGAIAAIAGAIVDSGCDFDMLFCIPEGVFMGFAIGYLFGSAAGVYFVGNTRYATGSFLAVFAGSIIGPLMGFFNGRIMANALGLAILVSVGAPVGSTIMFNLTRRYK